MIVNLPALKCLNRLKISLNGILSILSGSVNDSSIIQLVNLDSRFDSCRDPTQKLNKKRGTKTILPS